MNVLETAVAASKAGICVVPVKEDGSKEPDLRKWTHLQERLPNKDELTDWFVKRERTGIGFICGVVSGGLELLEFDEPAIIVAYKAAAVEAGLWELVKRLERGYCEATPGGGVHWIFRTEKPIKNTKLASKPCPGAPECTKHIAGKPHVLIETRGEGGFVVVAPSHGDVHPSKKPYELHGGGIDSIPTLTIEERDDLYVLAQMFDQLQRPAAEPRPHIRDDAPQDRPGDDFNRRADWMADVLAPHGWTVSGRSGHLTKVRRPGKTEGHSATFGPRGADGVDYLYVFSSSTELDPERGYSKYAAYTILNHGSDTSDFSTSARELRTLGYGGEYDSVESIIKDAPAAELIPPGKFNSPPPHQEPVDLEYRFEPVFPPDHFVSQYIAWASRLVDAAWEYHEATALVLLSCAIPSVRAYLNAHRRGLKANLYLVLVGDSSVSRKSTAVDYGVELLDEFMADTVIADRASPEGFIQDIAARNHRSALWAPDEFADHYERIKRRDPDMIEILLTLYGSKNYSKQRANKRVRGTQELIHDSDRIVNPNFSILGATTPSIFATVTQLDVESGMFVRFAFVYPTGKPSRMPLKRLTAREDAGRDELSQHLFALKNWCEAHFSPDIADTDIKADFTDEALLILDVFEEEMERQPESILRRLSIMACKVAMLGAVGEQVPSGGSFAVEARHAEWGVALARKWSRYSLLFQDGIGGSNPRHRESRQVIAKALRYLRENGGRVSRSAMAKHLDIPAREVTETGETMADQGLIFLEKVSPGVSGGRPATFWNLAVIAGENPASNPEEAP